MKHFAGFPAKMEFTPIPNPFFNHLMPQISDITELKTTLHIFMTIYGKRGYPRFISYGELSINASLMRSLGQTNKLAEEALRNALELAVKRGTILHMAVDCDGKPEDIYFLNNISDRQAMAKVQNGELKLPGLKVKTKPPAQTEEPPNIYALYEENIGMLTPMIAEELKEAEKLYPETWIRDAIKKSVNQNKRKWDYISAILERWTAEGRKNGTYKRDAKKEGPEKYAKQRYGHMVQH